MSIQNKVDAAVLHVLDRAGWNSLSGPHSHIAEVHGLARRYPVDVSPFNAVADEANPGAWADLHELIGDDGVAIVVAKEFVVPNGWELVEKGVGHFVGSVMPGIKDNTVLAGHRDSVFSKLGKLVVGDLVTISTSDGTFIYSVTKTRIVLPTDKTVIVPTPNATLTLITCYPSYYIGSAPKRYIVSADLVNQ